MIFFAGHLYTQHRITDEKEYFVVKIETAEVSINLSIQYFYINPCVFGRCYTNVHMEVFLKEPSEHSHAPDPNRIHIIRLRNEIKNSCW